jgi:hypothetical protein
MIALPHAVVSKLDSLDQAARTNQAQARDLADLIASKQQLLSQAMSAADQQKKVSSIESEIQRLTAKQLTYRRRCDNDRSAATRCRSYLAQLSLNGGHAELSVAAVSKPRLAKNENVTDAIRKVRFQIAELRDELRAVVTAPLAAGDLREAAQAYVKKLASEAGVRITGADGRQRLGVTYSDGPPPNLLAWVAPDLLVNAIVRDAGVSGGMSVSGKKSRAAKLGVEILAAERTEEALVTLAQAHGEDVLRRDDASALAILGIELADQRDEVAA